MVPALFAQAINWVISMYIMAGLTIVNMAVATAASINQRQERRQARDAALRNYDTQLQMGRMQTAAFASSRASSKSLKAQAQKYRQISEEMVEDASDREKASRQKPGYSPRSLGQRHKDFGNIYSVWVDEKTEVGETLLEDEMFLTSNFGVENFNNKLMEDI